MLELVARTSDYLHYYCIIYYIYKIIGGPFYYIYISEDRKYSIRRGNSSEALQFEIRSILTRRETEFVD